MWKKKIHGDSAIRMFAASEEKIKKCWSRNANDEHEGDSSMRNVFWFLARPDYRFR